MRDDAWLAYLSSTGAATASGTGTKRIEDMDADETIKLGVRAVLEVVEAGADNVEVAVLTKGKTVKYLSPEEVAKIVEEIEAERAEEEEKKKTRPSAST